MTQNIKIYSDGASRGNPGRGGFGAILIYEDGAGVLKVDEYGGREDVTTNNRMELLGVITALESLSGYYPIQHDPKKIEIYTDSAYVIQGIKSWIFGWKRNNWVTKTKEPVKNVDLWKRLSDAVDTCTRTDFELDWIQVPGHAGIPGNERCDQIATTFADAVTSDTRDEEPSNIQLFKGFASAYQFQDILKEISRAEISDIKSEQKISGKKSTKGAVAYSYVTCLNGKITTYSNWKDCEHAVKGVKGVKYKKSISKSDEEKIIAEFLS